MSGPCRSLTRDRPEVITSPRRGKVRGTGDLVYFCMHRCVGRSCRWTIPPFHVDGQPCTPLPGPPPRGRRGPGPLARLTDAAARLRRGLRRGLRDPRPLGQLRRQLRASDESRVPRAGGAKLGGGARPATCAGAYERGARGRELDQGGVASAPGGSSDEEPRRRRRRARWELLDRGVSARRLLLREAAAAAATRAVGAAGGGSALR